jgi:long-chain acyl-CoA synthetase
MNFIQDILGRLVVRPDKIALQEVRDGRISGVTRSELLSQVDSALRFLRKAGIKQGDRCVLLANNSIRWVAADLAMMAEGIIVVPLYARQAPSELVGMIRDSGASLICCGDDALSDGIKKAWPDAPPIHLFDEIFSSNEPVGEAELARPITLSDDDPVTIIYTSGTSGEPKGVILNVANLNHMLVCTNGRLDLLIGQREDPERVFHYLPFCFAGSWILLLTCLTRDAVLTMSTDLNKLVDELKAASPNYFLNVPALLERVKTGIESQLEKKGGLALAIYTRAKAAWFRRQAHAPSGLDWLWLGIAEIIVFPAIKKKLGPVLKALICGSAPLAKDTQLFFMMIGMPVLQVYGLTETTAICTMDHPHQVTPGRVGPAISRVEMKLGEGNEILVRGPNIFPGYWNRPQESARVMDNGWFRTGDQGEVDQDGNWAVIGRLKNLIIPSSGHNIAPEPIEEMVLKNLPGAQQMVIVGNGRSHLSAIITGDMTSDQVEAALETVNAQLPHYKCIRAFHIDNQPFTIENGLLTANGKLKRDQIAATYKEQIERMYRANRA